MTNKKNPPRRAAGKKPTSEKPESQSSKSEDTPKIVLKKYPNRRIYNTATSSYIVLSDVIDMLNEGVEFEVVDAKTGDDITRSILNQIIFERENQSGQYMLPLEFQKQLIRLYGDAYMGMVPDYLTQSIQFFAAERDRMGKALNEMVGENASSFMKMGEAMARQNMEFMQTSFRNSMAMFGMPAGNSESDDSVSPDEAEAPQSREKTLREVQAQIDALQQQLKSLK